MPDDIQKVIFSQNLSRLIERSHKSQKEVAIDIGTSPQNLNNWVKGISLPRMGMVQKLADYFNVSKSDLIDEYKESSERERIVQVIENLSEEDIKKLKTYIRVLQFEKAEEEANHFNDDSEDDLEENGNYFEY